MTDRTWMVIDTGPSNGLARFRVVTPDSAELATAASSGLVIRVVNEFLSHECAREIADTLESELYED